MPWATPISTATPAALEKEQAEARAQLDQQRSEAMLAREQAELQARQAVEAESTAEKHSLSQSRARAELQRKAAQLALQKAREDVALTKAERERVAFEQQALAAVQASVLGTVRESNAYQPAQPVRLPDFMRAA